MHLLLALVLSQAVYEWEDRDGVHYTDDLSQVPRGAKVKKQDLQASPPSPAPAVAPPSMPSPPPLSSQNEAAWRRRFIDAIQKINVAQQRVAELEPQLPPGTELPPACNPRATADGRPPCQAGFRVTRMGTVRPMPNPLLVQFDDAHTELRHAKEQLAQLEAEAQRLEIPREWRRGW